MSYAPLSLLWPFEGVAWPATFLPVVMSTTGTFDTLNPLLSTGELADGSPLVFETLTKSADDELRWLDA